MVARGLAVSCLCGLLAGCAAWWGGPGAPTCPIITDVNAWTNRQPSTGGDGQVTLVTVSFEAPSQMRLYRDGTAPPETLALDLQASDQPALMAISYRERVRVPPREQVVISCGGDVLARLDSIDDIY